MLLTVLEPFDDQPMKDSDNKAEAEAEAKVGAGDEAATRDDDDDNDVASQMSRFTRC